MYLVDTNILIYGLNGHERVMARLREVASVPKAVSVISYGELLYGAQKSARPAANLARVRRLREILPIADVTPAVMETFGLLKADLEAGGRRLDDFDLVIASTALTLGYRLVTNNEKHFARIEGLALESWLD